MRFLSLRFAFYGTCQKSPGHFGPGTFRSRTSYDCKNSIYYKMHVLYILHRKNTGISFFFFNIDKI